MELCTTPNRKITNRRPVTNTDAVAATAYIYRQRYTVLGQQFFMNIFNLASSFLIYIYRKTLFVLTATQFGIGIHLEWTKKWIFVAEIKIHNFNIKIFFEM